MKPLALSLSVANATEGDEYGEPATLVLDLADVELARGPRGRERADKPSVEATGSDGSTPDTDFVPGAPYWSYDGLLDEADDDPEHRLVPGEQSGSREIKLNVHAGVQEFTVPLHLRMRVIVVSEVLGPAGGRLEHPGGAYIDVPEGFGFEARMSLEQLPDDGKENTISGIFAVEIASVGAEATSKSRTPQRAVSAAAVAVNPQWLQVGLSLSKDVSTSSQIRAEAGPSAANIGLWYAVETAKITSSLFNTRLGFLSGRDTRLVLRYVERVLLDDCVYEGFLPAPEDQNDAQPMAHVVYLHGWKPGRDDCVTFDRYFDPNEEGSALFAHLNREDGLAAAAKYWRYTYASYKAIDDSAELLVSKLKAQFTENDHVVLVGHSMGGLVARAAAERYEADTYVDRIITLGTPHYGSKAATVDFWKRGGVPIETSFVYGLAPDPLLSQGTRSLQPGSDFFEGLKRFGSGAGTVPLSTFAGDIGPGSNYDCLHDFLFTPGFSCISYQVADEIFREQLEEEGSDGAVPYSSARLNDDFHESEFGIGYDHTDLRKGRAQEGGTDPLLTRVAELVEETVLPSEPSSGVWRAAGAGVRHTCGVTETGEAYCWGWNEHGQLGDGTTTSHYTPTKVATSLQLASIAAGGVHTCGLTDTGEAYCWGKNRFGRLGDGTTTNHHTPTKVATSLQFASVTAGVSHTCGVTEAGEAYCWGWNQYGQIGDGTITYGRHSPTKVATSLRFTSVAAGHYHTCGVTETGEAYCWGDNRYGELGDGTIRTRRKTPTRVATSLQFASVATGKRHTCGVTEAGEAYCWGRNELGQLGDGTTSIRLTPIPVATSLQFASVITGYYHTCGHTDTGEIYCWGENGRGQLGDGTTTNRQSPTPVATSLRFGSVAGNLFHSCALTSEGMAYCWGWNRNGELGDGTTTSRPMPVQVIDPSAPVAQ